MTSLTLRIPKGLWADLEETVIQQDRQFLIEVARNLGLPIQEVLRRCLGTGAATPIPVLWMPCGSDSDSDSESDSESESKATKPHNNKTTCPWWTASGSLWKACTRPRLSPSLPCLLHECACTSAKTRLGSDPFILALPKRWPVRLDSTLYWADPAGLEPALHEDGRPMTEGRFRFSIQNGKRAALFIKNTNENENTNEATT